MDTLEEELLSIANSYNPENPKTNGPVEKREEPEAPQDDGWFEVGKRNRMAVTRTVSIRRSNCSIILYLIMIIAVDQVLEVSHHTDLWW